MKHASWVVGGCLIAAGVLAQPAHSQQAAQQYQLPAGSVGTMASTDQTTSYSAYIKDPSPTQVRAIWGLDVPGTSHYNAYIHDPTPAQVAVSWGYPSQQGLSNYNPYHK